MTVRHHPDETLLLAYAAGGLDKALALITATHLSFCAQCSGQISQAERIGGVLLEDIVPVSLQAGALEKCMARLDEPQVPRFVPISNDNTPAPLRAFLGRDLSDVRWRRMGPRLAYATLYRRGPLAMRLLRGAPGADVGQHTHLGMEYTLVLQGGYTDTMGSYGPGDFQIASPGVNHNPVADPGADCVNLAVATGSLRFEGVMQKIVARLFGF